MRNKVEQAITDLLAIGVEKGYIDPLDKILKQNQLLALLKKESLGSGLIASHPLPEAKALLPTFLDFAVETGVIEESITEQAIFSAQVMAILTPDTSVVNRKFWEVYAHNPKEATDWFYDLSRDNDYIQTEAIAKNIAFDYASDYGNLELTINLSKPEKDPKAIAAALMTESVHYPLCQLCLENEGYSGTLTHPARANHRIVRFPMDGETWGLQYSPYAYYTEHCIFLASEHRPMKIEEKTFQNLFGIVEQFPHYFVGSNADLPIVGGSILSHDHYQGGRYSFPMDKAPVKEAFTLEAFPEVSFGIVKWPMSVIRMESVDKQALTKAAVHILEQWRGYSDETVDIIAFSQETPHNTITPIARRDGEKFVCDLVLRNNRTSDVHPDGIFHPHRDVQHIKKENIGLIEVMGLAILPPRLKDELAEVEKYLAGEENALADMHREWADGIVVSDGDYRQAIEDAVGAVFQRVLEDAGVYKMTAEGLAAFKRFVDSL
ncbi:UDP-glucose--hexose-1-phosphate uridylyltransferase [Jeotgalibaca sp. A127]|uniref:UDP-glucose--hexose-1-phosphate uridylyltransferase n=1 Tax=Jeotgalibaca sp. A127 TaxID=3457324 RepID=UPI003FD47F45